MSNKNNANLELLQKRMADASAQMYVALAKYHPDYMTAYVLMKNHIDSTIKLIEQLKLQ